MTTAQAAELILVNRVASRSTPGTAYEIKVNPHGDYGSLSCNCKGWTNQTHLPTCAAVLHGLKCSCRDFPREQKTARTCRHLRWVQGKIAEAGGWTIVWQRVQRGMPLPGSDLPSAPPTGTAQARTVLIEEARRVIQNGPTRVLVDAHGLALSPAVARNRHVRPSIVFIRNDGWSLGAPLGLVPQARNLYPDKWVGVLWLMSSTTAESVMDYQTWARQADGQPPATRPTSRRRETPVPAPAPVAPDNDLSWIGGGRAILLMD